MSFDAIQTAVTRKSVEHATELERVAAAESLLTTRKAETETAVAAFDVIVSVVGASQQAATAAICDVVNHCLAAVFPDPYEFRIIIEEKSGRMEARCLLERDGVSFDPLTQCGGGVIDIVAFALRVAALSLARPRPRQIIIADEPFRFVSRDYRPAVARMIEVLAERTGMQFVIVTHHPELMIGNVVEVG